MYKNFLHFFVLSCEKATFLIEKQLHTRLSSLERLQLRVHLSLCQYCTAYKHKALFLHKLMSCDEMTGANRNPFSEEEITYLKERVKTAIKENSVEDTPEKKG